jgi:hypothetical protein
MARREHFKQSLEHEGCDQTGQAILSEVENPVFSKGSLDQRISQIPEGFTKRGTNIVCEKCSTVVFTCDQ